MAFFRIKKIKGKEYVYIVENTWNRKGSRQKVKGYIGKAHRFNLKNDITFLQFAEIENFNDYIENSEKNKIINDLVKWELYKHDINKEYFTIDINNAIIQKNNKNSVLLINDGFLCNLTLKNLINFKPEEEHTDAYRLARAFVEAGIKVPHDVFVGLFSKLYKIM